jgi:hypothetical protein
VVFLSYHLFVLKYRDLLHLHESDKDQVQFLQPWPNEAERQKVLDEKHARGGRARALRRAVKSLKSRG